MRLNNRQDRGKRMRRPLLAEPSRSVLDYERYLDVEPNGRLHFKVEPAGEGYFHPLTKDEVRARLAQLPQSFLKNLHTVYMPRMTRKRKLLNIYGLQWGYAIYLYPMPVTLKEELNGPCKPLRRIEYDKFGATVTDIDEDHVVQWDMDSIKCFYRDNILIHELGHITDDKNSREVERERYAEEFVTKWGRRK